MLFGGTHKNRGFTLILNPPKQNEDVTEERWSLYKSGSFICEQRLVHLLNSSRCDFPVPILTPVYGLKQPRTSPLSVGILPFDLLQFQKLLAIPCLTSRNTGSFAPTPVLLTFQSVTLQLSSLSLSFKIITSVLALKNEIIATLQSQLLINSIS